MQINPSQLGAVRPLSAKAESAADQLEGATKLRDAYRDFVGKTFYSQMVKSMRSTVGKASYFDGGQTEEVFRSQLDQHFVDGMSRATAGQFADPMFRQQFPAQARLLAAADAAAPNGFDDLAALRRL